MPGEPERYTEEEAVRALEHAAAHSSVRDLVAGFRRALRLGRGEAPLVRVTAEQRAKANAKMRRRRMSE